MKLPIDVPHADLERLCRAYHVRKLAFFGSVLTPDFRPDSDLDILVEFAPDHIPGFLGLSRLERELSALFGGRKVDLRTPAELSHHFRNEVLASAEVAYGQG